MKRQRVLLALQYYHAEYHAGAARFAREAGWVLDALYAHAHGETPNLGLYDGIVVHALQKDDLRRSIEGSDIPAVDLGGTLQRAGVPKIMHDYPAFGVKAADYFITKAWKHLAFYIFKPLDGLPPFREPLYWQHFQKTALARGRKAYLLEWTGKTGRLQWLARRLAELPKPLAVWTADDPSAAEVLDAAFQVGLRVPDQLAVLGTHNEALVCDFSLVPLSSLDGQRQQQAYVACRILDQLMHGRRRQPPKTVIAPGDIVERMSTGHPQETVTAGLKRALQLIDTRFARPMMARDVARAAGMSLRLLQRQLRIQTGRSLTEMLILRRIECARKLLLQSGDSVERVAEACGYGSASAFTQAFTREVGLSPRRFRSRS